MFVRVLAEFASRYHATDAGRREAFDPNRTYEVHDILRAPEVSGGYVVLVNDTGEIFFVDTRHVRALQETGSVSQLAAVSHGA